MNRPSGSGSWAEVSSCGRYRYALGRWWDSSRRSVLFIGLNPSTANASLDDPTLRRCMRFAQTWGYGGIVLANLFAFRSIRPHVLAQLPDPIGPDNDAWLNRLRAAADLAVAAWGNGGSLQNRAAVVAERLAPLHCLGRTLSGAPRHPLYVPADTELLEMV